MDEPETPEPSGTAAAGPGPSGAQSAERVAAGPETPGPDATGAQPPGSAADAADPRPSFWDDDLPVRSSLAVIDTSAPHPYRMYNFMIGGKDNFQVDRGAVSELLKAHPDIALTALAVESFCARAVVELAKAGIRQFVQLGIAISIPRSHDAIARDIAPDTRFVYVAEDPVSLIHARAVLAEENVGIIGGDFRDPRRMLAEPALTGLVDLDQPCGFLLFGMLDYIAGDRRARAALQSIYKRAAPGSYLAFVHVLAPDGPVDPAAEAVLMQGGIQLTPRHVPEIEKLIEGFELWDEEGLLPVVAWRPGSGPGERGPGPETAERAAAVGGVIVKR